MRLIAACLWLAASAPLAETHTDAVHGFRIDVLDGWHTSSRQLDEHRFVLQLLPPGSKGERAVTVIVGDLEEGQDEAALLARSRERAKDPASGISDWEEWEGELAGRPCHGIRAVVDSELGPVRIVQGFVLEGGHVYTVQRHAPVAEYDGLSAGFEAVADTFGLVERSPAAAEEERLDRIAARCGSEVDWAADWAVAARRARAENKLVLVAAYLVPGFAIHDTPRNTTFMDQDVLALVRERFVPLWYERGMDGAFAERYGLGPHSFGQALLVVTPDGAVVEETNVASAPEVALSFLRAALERHPGYGGGPVPGPDAASPLERATLLVARGEHAAARELLAGDDSAAAAMLRVTMLRREEKGAEALAALAASGVERTPDVQVLEAELRMREGQRDRARELFDAVIAAQPESEAGRKARVLRGLLDLPGDRAAALARWRALALEAPDSRWGWKAAADLRSTVLAVDVEPDLGWPDPDVLAEVLRTNEPAPVPLDHAREAAEGAFRWLLAHQQADGSWSGPTELRRAEGMGPNPFEDATAALAGDALLLHGSSPDAGAAARRALDYLVASVERRSVEPPVVLFMDYMTWSDSMILRFVCDALEHGLGDAEGLAPIAAALVDDLAARQQAGGGWSYYVTSDLGGDGAPSNSISFTTAAAVRALVRAGTVGFPVPDDVLRPALGALEKMRQEDGTFAYFLFHDSGDTTSGTEPAGAVGRGPVCELALLDAGRSTPERLDAALARFLERRDLYSAEQGKAVMHAGPHGQGCHYLLFDYAHAALARERLGPDPASRVKILELVLDCRQPDGSFLDTPLLGHAYGTAMALTALDALAD